MSWNRSRKQACAWLLLVSGLGLASGCAKWSTIKRNCLPFGCAEQPPKAAIMQTEHCADLLPSESVPSPPGTYVQRWHDAMAYQADEQQLMVTRNLWFDGGNQLGPNGQDHLMAIGKRLSCEPATVLIEEEPVQVQAGQTYEEAVFATARLNTQRRSAIMHGLTALQIPFAEEWIVFTSDRSVGVRGVEAPNVYNRQFSGQGSGNRGGLGRGGLGGGGAGGLGGGGFGGGGFGGLGGGGGGFGGGMGGLF